MRTYGKRFLKSGMQRIADAKSETRDAAVIDIDLVNSCCRVKIQGSDEYIIAQFPSMARHAPEWLRPGCAARICHRGGVRGRVEVAGPGQIVPTGNNLKPPQEIVSEDCILSGCEISLPTVRRNIFGAGKGVVWIMRGTYRVNGSVRQVKAVRCRATNPIMAENAPRIGAIAEQFILTLPPDESWAYHRFVLNKVSGAIEKLSAGNVVAPVLPVVPTGYLDCGWLLLQGGQSTIDESTINATYQQPTPCYFLISGSTALNFDVNSAAYAIKVYDQYARPVSCSMGKWSADITIGSGTGFVSSLAVLSAARSIRVYSQPGSNELLFWYYRNTAGVEKSPKLTIVVNEMPESVNELNIVLLNQSGSIL